MFRSRGFLLVACAFVAGCTTVRVPEAKQQTDVAALIEKLRNLAPSVTRADAADAADAAVRYPLQRAQEYHATPPAVVNNMLINAGIHPDTGRA